MNICILGPQGSGKGTQASMLAQKYSLFYFDAGRFLRELAKTRPDIDEIINKRGELLDDDQMFKLMQTDLEGHGLFDNLLFDGFPRSIKQFELLDSYLESKDKKIDFVILINISDDEAVRRLSARRIDQKTGKIYNLITNPPPSDIKQADLTQRQDDIPDAIKQRLSMYHSSTQPLVDYLKQNNLLVEVNGERPIDEIQNEIVSLIDQKTQ